MTNQLIDNEELKRYDMPVEGGTPFIEYIKAQNYVCLNHTEVPKALEGQGLGSAIIKLALETIKQEGKKILPMCPFVRTYIQRHPEWDELVMPGVKFK